MQVDSTLDFRTTEIPTYAGAWTIELAESIPPYISVVELIKIDHADRSRLPPVPNPAGSSSSCNRKNERIQIHTPV